MNERLYYGMKAARRDKVKAVIYGMGTKRGTEIWPFSLSWWQEGKRMGALSFSLSEESLSGSDGSAALVYSCRLSSIKVKPEAKRGISNFKQADQVHL